MNLPPWRGWRSTRDPRRLAWGLARSRGKLQNKLCEEELQRSLPERTRQFSGGRVPPGGSAARVDPGLGELGERLFGPYGRLSGLAQRDSINQSPSTSQKPHVRRRTAPRWPAARHSCPRGLIYSRIRAKIGLFLGDNGKHRNTHRHRWVLSLYPLLGIGGHSRYRIQSGL